MCTDASVYMSLFRELRSDCWRADKPCLRLRVAVHFFCMTMMHLRVGTACMDGGGYISCIVEQKEERQEEIEPHFRSA